MKSLYFEFVARRWHCNIDGHKYGFMVKLHAEQFAERNGFEPVFIPII